MQEQRGWRLLKTFKWSLWKICSDIVLVSGLFSGSCAFHLTCFFHLYFFYWCDNFVNVEVFQNGSIKILTKCFLKTSLKSCWIVSVIHAGGTLDKDCGAGEEYLYLKGGVEPERASLFLLARVTSLRPGLSTLPGAELSRPAHPRRSVQGSPPAPMEQHGLWQPKRRPRCGNARRGW